MNLEDGAIRVLTQDELALAVGGMDFDGRRMSTNVESQYNIGPFIVIYNYLGEVIRIEVAQR